MRVLECARKNRKSEARLLPVLPADVIAGKWPGLLVARSVG